MDVNNYQLVELSNEINKCSKELYIYSSEGAAASRPMARATGGGGLVPSRALKKAREV